MFNSFYKLVIVIVIAVALVNDIGVITTGYYDVESKAKRIAEAAVFDYNVNHSETMALAAAQELATRESVNLTGWQVTDDKVRVSIEIPPRRTWIANRISALRPYISATALVELPLK